jgi:tetratricopeptide (TPR) repeat protein
VVVSAAILVVMAVVGLSVSTALLWRERGRTLAEQRRTLAEQRRTVAEQARTKEALAQAQINFEQARNAVDDYYTLVSQSMLLERPDLIDLRKELLETALTYYQDFAEQRSEDPEIQAELVAAYFRVAEIRNVMGSSDWLKPAQKGVKIAERLVAENADVSRFPSWGAGILKLRFVLVLPLAYSAEVRDFFQKTIEIWERLVQGNPNVAGLQSDLGAFYLMAGYGLQCGGDPSAALCSYDRAREVWEKLVGNHPTEPEYRYRLGLIEFEFSKPRNALGITGARQEEAGRRALDLFDKLASDFPNVPAYAVSLAEASSSLGEILSGSSRLEEAENLHDKGMAICEKLLAEFPSAAGYRSRLQICYQFLAGHLNRAGRPLEAVAVGS